MTAAALFLALLLPASPAEVGQVGDAHSRYENKARTMSMWHPIYSKKRWSIAGPDARGRPRPALFPSDSLAWPAAGAIEARVRSLVAARWDVQPDAVVLEWGVVDAPWIPGAEVALSLTGSGHGGWWTVQFRGLEEYQDDFLVRFRAGVAVPTPVATRRLERGVTLEASDIRWSETPIWGEPQEGSSRVVEPGWVTRRVVRTGELLAPPTVDRPVLVEGGRDVEIQWERGTISLKLRGRAIQSGAMGERVWVRTESGHRLEGTVDGPGRVVVLGSGEAVA